MKVLKTPLKSTLTSLYVGLVLAFTVTSLGLSYALDVPSPGMVVDLANVLSEQEEAAISAAIADEQGRSGTQLGILTIASLEGDSLEDYSIRVANEWGIGRNDLDNGALVLVAVEDRQTRIEVGRGLEGALTDIESGRIIDYRMIPEFRNGNYAAGLLAGVDGIRLAIADEFDPAALQEPSNPSSGWFGVVFFAIMFLQWIIAILARTKSWWFGGLLGGGIGAGIASVSGFSLIPGIVGVGLLGLLLDWLVSRKYVSATKNGARPPWWAGGSSGGFGGSSSGGSSGGFGGGSFGGGGASGRW